MTEAVQNGLDSRVEFGGIIEGSGKHAFTLKIPRNSPLPVLISVPHAGRDYPDSVTNRMRQAGSTSVRLEDRYADKLAAEIARLTGVPLIVAHAPRAMLDLNRAREDMDWGMVVGEKGDLPRHSQANRRARSGLGLIPRRLSGFGEIWKDRISNEELEARIEGIHRPYHSAIAHRMEQIRDEWGAVLLIDLHSMPPLRQRLGDTDPPLVVVGDRFGSSCDSSLAGTALRFLELKGIPATHNRPYSGGYVLDRHAVPARGLHALQLEICRSSYLDSELLEPSERLAEMAGLVAGLVRELGAAAARIAHIGGIAQAAE
ncbi:MAG: N-formylglutamate amidohydrolase [Alphaproteobacteria bacterium]|nr:MAG: N-formylglutamate amidohydrolase [Alphaproteobacteria bacterium]